MLTKCYKPGQSWGDPVGFPDFFALAQGPGRPPPALLFAAGAVRWRRPLVKFFWVNHGQAKTVLDETTSKKMWRLSRHRSKQQFSENETDSTTIFFKINTPESWCSDTYVASLSLLRCCFRSQGIAWRSSWTTTCWLVPVIRHGCHTNFWPKPSAFPWERCAWGATLCAWPQLMQLGIARRPGERPGERQYLGHKMAFSKHLPFVKKTHLEFIEFLFKLLGPHDLHSPVLLAFRPSLVWSRNFTYVNLQRSDSSSHEGGL